MPGNALIQLRRDTAANWTATNPVLALAEPGLETDTGKIKYGDGVSAWSALGYWSGGGAVSDGDKGDISILSGVWSIKANAPNILNKVIATDRASMAGLNTVQIAYLEGTPWAFASGDQSALVTADPNQIVAVAPTSDTTGHSGAWIKQFSGPVWADWFGVSTSSADNYAAFNRARTVANALARVLKVKAGVFIFNQATPSFVLVDYEQIDGSGAGTVFHFTDTLASAGTIFLATGKKNIRLTNFRFEANSLRTSSNQGIWFQDCVDCYAENVSSDKWTQPFISDRTNPGGTTIPPATTNLRNKFVRCISYSSRSYGFFIQFGTACALIDCEAYGSSAYDGFKLGGGNMFCKVRGCHSEGNAADGFDTYDGWITCSISDCTAFNNGAQGFQFKGHFGGSYGATDYVTRESAYSNLLAKGNALSGFLFQETRLGGCSNLVAIGNGTAGFVLNNIQGFAFSACVANRNTQHGWVFLSTSRCTFSSCNAIDNSFVDGTIQNGLYDGFNFDSLTGNCYFGSCLSHNGTAAGLLGGQAYGFNLGTAAGNIFVGCAAISNITGPVGGTTPYDNNNFSLFQTPTSFLGWKATGAAGEQQLTSTSNVTAYLKRTGGAFLYLQSTATSALIGSVAAFPLTFSTNSSGRWNVTASGHFSPVSDNAYDIGTAGTARVRNYFGAGNITVGGAVSASNVSGTNTGDQFTATAASKLLGRGSAAGAGAAQEITLGTGLSMSGTTLNASGGGGGLSDADYGDVVVSGAGTVMTVDAGAVSLSKMANLAANSIIGNNTGAAATPLALTATQTKALLNIGASDVGFTSPGGVATNVYSFIQRSKTTPLEFGAVGDGTASDTAAIIAAAATGRRVIIPEGYTFKIDNRITVPSGFQMEGNGGTLKFEGGAWSYAFWLAGNLSQVVFDGVQLFCDDDVGSLHWFRLEQNVGETLDEAMFRNIRNTYAPTTGPGAGDRWLIAAVGGGDRRNLHILRNDTRGPMQLCASLVQSGRLLFSEVNENYIEDAHSNAISLSSTGAIGSACELNTVEVLRNIIRATVGSAFTSTGIFFGLDATTADRNHHVRNLTVADNDIDISASSVKTADIFARIACLAAGIGGFDSQYDTITVANNIGRTATNLFDVPSAGTTTIAKATNVDFTNNQAFSGDQIIGSMADGCRLRDNWFSSTASLRLGSNNGRISSFGNSYGTAIPQTSSSAFTFYSFNDTWRGAPTGTDSPFTLNSNIAGAQKAFLFNPTINSFTTGTKRSAVRTQGTADPTVDVWNLSSSTTWSTGLLDQAATSGVITNHPMAGLAAISTSGSASDLIAGTVPAARFPALTGDVTTTAGSLATTLATVNSNTGTFGGATTSPQFSVNGKGLVTGVSAVTITPAWASITSKPTTLSGFGITDGQPLNANLTAYAGANWSAGTQIPALTAANTIALKTVGAATGNILDKAAGDSLYQPVGSYLTANQTITLSGDASGSGTTAITVTIGANKVTRGMLAAAAGATILGATGAGNVSDLTAAQAKTFLAIAASDVSGLAAVATSGSGADITPSIQAVASAATVTPTFSNNMVKITAQAVGLTLANPTGTAVAGRKLVIRIKDNGTGQTIAYGTQYRAIGVTLPTTTVANKTLYLGLVYNSDDTKWDVVAVSQEA